MIPIAKPWIGESEAEAARRVILSGWITQGPEVAAFEREFAESVKAPHACAVANCTTALHLALLAAGVGPGDEVITVSHSFIATANSIRYCGAVPVFVDICPETFNINVDQVEAAINASTRAILCVHQMGMPCDLARLLAIADKHSLPVIEDAACAIGSEVFWQGEWQRVGKPHGDAACFSFHPRKIVSTGDGGMITTKHKSWDDKFRLWRQHGMSASDSVRHASARVIFERYPEFGFNYRMTDIQAAVGREQLRRLPEVVVRRRELAATYHSLLQDISGLKLPIEPDWARTNWQSYCVGLPEDCDQRETMQVLLDAGIATRRGIMCVHREAAYQSQAWKSIQTLRCSEQAQDRGLILPLYPQMERGEQETVATGLRHALLREHVS
ncbi:MAG TPA: DegT/DnrJ/EryC1/StrS family aminotransferase [Bryobacteraceae bacterium]|nr:DegT/DnrJ/EryC1/StrS family aminotransferase [Bryobacteraceae bacterium]